MCGRYDYTPGEFRDIRIRWNLDNDLPQFKPTYDMAPDKDVPVIVREGERNQMKLMRWGLVSSWAKDPSIGNRLINARAETLAEKPCFKRLLSSRRCLVPAGGF
jgi:putative SOS response-associated peptidase YedK